MSRLESWMKQLAFACGYAIRRREHDGSLAAYTTLMLQHLGIGCVLDVGAHVGEFGAELRRYGYQGRLVSFEPVQANFAVLQQRCARDPNWTAYHLALGAQAATQPINVARDTLLSSFRTPTAFAADWYAASATARAELVTIKPLDDLFQECIAGLPNPQVYLQLDTQGWDLEVLKGATTSLASVRALQSELSVVPLYEGMPSYLEALPVFQRLGFQLSGLFPVTHDAAWRLVEVDCVMVRADAAALVQPGFPVGAWASS